MTELNQNQLIKLLNKYSKIVQKIIEARELIFRLPNEMGHKHQSELKKLKDVENTLMKEATQLHDKMKKGGD